MIQGWNRDNNELKSQLVRLINEQGFSNFLRLIIGTIDDLDWQRVNEYKMPFSYEAIITCLEQQITRKPRAILSR